MMTGQRRSRDELWYDDVEVYRFEYDPDTDDFGVDLVLALAEVTDVDPLEVTPLGPEVDTDRLQACVEALNGAGPTVEGKITFSAAGCEVTVLAGQVVIAVPRDADESVERRPE